RERTECHPEQRGGSRFFAPLRMTPRGHLILERSTSQDIASPTGGYSVIFVAAFGSKDEYGNDATIFPRYAGPFSFFFALSGLAVSPFVIFPPCSSVSVEPPSKSADSHQILHQSRTNFVSWL